MTSAPCLVGARYARTGDARFSSRPASKGGERAESTRENRRRGRQRERAPQARKMPPPPTRGTSCTAVLPRRPPACHAPSARRRQSLRTAVYTRTHTLSLLHKHTRCWSRGESRSSASRTPRFRRDGVLECFPARLTREKREREREGAQEGGAQFGRLKSQQPDPQPPPSLWKCSGSRRTSEKSQGHRRAGTKTPALPRTTLREKKTSERERATTPSKPPRGALRAPEGPSSSRKTGSILAHA